MARRRRGGNAIEFALLLPVLFGLLTGIMDYGWFYGLKFASDSAARQGARVGALTPQGEDPNGTALLAATDRWTQLGMPGTPTVVSFRSGAAPLETMVVRVQLNVASLVGFVVGPSTIESTAVQRMEEQP